jgi:hypothetical protein
MGMFGAYLLYLVGKATSVKNQWAFVTSGFVVISIALILGFNLVKIKT